MNSTLDNEAEVGKCLASTVTATCFINDFSALKSHLQSQHTSVKCFPQGRSSVSVQLCSQTDGATAALSSLSWLPALPI